MLLYSRGMTPDASETQRAALAEMVPVGKTGVLFLLDARVVRDEALQLQFSGPVAGFSRIRTGERFSAFPSAFFPPSAPKGN